MHESKRLGQGRLWKNCVEESRSDLCVLNRLTACFLSARQIDLRSIVSKSSRRGEEGARTPRSPISELIAVLENLEITHECAHLESSPVALLDVGKVEQDIFYDVGR
jgi:hypothetical protein